MARVLESTAILSSSALNPQVLSSNTASACVLPRLGMVQEGLLREFARKGDAFHDVVMMALLWKEWPPVQKVDRPGAGIATQKALS